MSEQALIEFVVTLKSMEDLDSFYDDMETLGGDLYIPDRAVDCYMRRPTSRNTHYMLTYEEAESLKKDPRVVAVSLAEAGRLAIKPVWTQTGVYNKSSGNSSSYSNWGLHRVTITDNLTNWGTSGVEQYTTTTTVTASGRGVDVVIIDGHIHPDHPEYAVNSDGSGGSRVSQINWFQYNSIVSGLDNDGAAITTETSYVYSPYADPLSASRTADNNHGAHVAGTAAGNTQGWARDAQIYNISPYGSNPNDIDGLALWDYIRAFHRSKTPDPNTGIRRPTICNGSYGMSLTFPYDYGGGITTGPITGVYYRGNWVSTSTTFTDAQLASYGIYAVGGVATVPYFYAPYEADIQDAIADGVIVVAAAANDSFKVDVLGGVDYDNFFSATYAGGFYAWDYHKGTVPGAAEGVICVGAVGSTYNETKATFSNCGPRIDVYAPGRYIMSSFNSSDSYGGVTDPRNSSFVLGKISGTSMASPQVTGVLACILEVYPRFNQTDIREYLAYFVQKNKMTDTAGGASDLTSLQGSQNNYLYFPKERQTEGSIYPKQNFDVRPTKGQAYPRTRIFRYGSH